MPTPILISQIHNIHICACRCARAQVQKLKYIAVATNDLAKTLGQYRAVGIKCSEPYAVPKAQVGVFVADFKNMLVEVVTPLGASPNLRKWLDAHHNGGIHHIGYTVADLDKAIGTVKYNGCAER